MADGFLLTEQVLALAQEDAWWAPLMANASALLYQSLPDLNWAGFYLVRDGRLTLGPFQGKAACIHIERGRGVCGTAWRDNRTVRVPDVHAFPGHIACDGASNAEIVIPLRDGAGCVRAVMDLDSPVFGRFSAADQEMLEAFARAIEACVRWDA